MLRWIGLAASPAGEATDHFSGPGRAFGPVCVCLCVRTITLELNNLRPRYLACWFVIPLSRTESKIKVMCQSSRSQEKNVAKVVGATSSGGFLHRVSKNVPPLACYNFDTREWSLTFFGRNVTDKVGNQKTLYYATSSNLCFSLPGKTGKRENHIFTQSNCVSHNTIHLCAVFVKEKVVICDVFDSV